MESKYISHGQENNKVARCVKRKIKHSVFLQNLAAEGQRGSKIVCWQTRKTRLLMPLRKYSHNKLKPPIHLADRWQQDCLIPDGNTQHWLFPCQPFSPHWYKCVLQALFPKSWIHHLGSAENICWNSCKQNLNKSLFQVVFFRSVWSLTPVALATAPGQGHERLGGGNFSVLFTRPV